MNPIWYLVEITQDIHDKPFGEQQHPQPPQMSKGAIFATILAAKRPIEVKLLKLSNQSLPLAQQMFISNKKLIAWKFFTLLYRNHNLELFS